MRSFTLATVTAGTALAGTVLLVPTAAFADTPAAPAAAPSTSPAKGCATGELPAAVIGSPDVRAHQAKGVYLWHGKNGYALRVTEASSKRLVVTGTITVSGDLSNVKRVRLEKNDRMVVRGRTLTFRFVNDGGIDGFDFAAECSKTVRVALRTAGAPLAPEQVFLGAHRQHPTSVPFTIERAADAPAAPAAQPSTQPSSQPSTQAAGV